MTYRTPDAVRIDDRTVVIPADIDAWSGMYGRDPLVKQDARACADDHDARACPAERDPRASAAGDEHDPRACPARGCPDNSPS